MTPPLRVFAVHSVFLFRYDDGQLPPQIESYYNAAQDRYELPFEELLETLEGAVGEVVVEPVEEFTVEFHGAPPPDVEAAALLVERRGPTTSLLLPTDEAVERAIDAGGSRPDP